MASLTTPYQNVRGRKSLDPPKNHAEKMGRVLMRHYQPTARGLTLVKRDGVWEALSSVTQDELEAAEEYYLGGHDHDISYATGQELVDAGFVEESATDAIVEPIIDEVGEIAFTGVEL